MRTIITKTNIYKFEELSEEAQQNALNNLRDINVDYKWWDFEIEYWKDELFKIGFEAANIQFTGFSSQGDGASFEANINLEKIINHIIMCDFNRCDSAAFLAMERMEYYGLIDLNFSCDRISHRYSHENTCGIDLDFNCYQDNISDKAYSVLESWVNQLRDDIESIRYDLCQTIYQSLEKEYWYLQGDEQVKETIKIIDYEFTEDGKLY